MTPATHNNTPDTPTAVITGGSKGLGRVMTETLLRRGWKVVTDARDGAALNTLPATPRLVAIAGDVTSAAHRHALVAAAGPTVDLLINNASTLGTTPLRPLAAHDDAELRDVMDINVFAPHALTVALLPALRSTGGVVINISSDAAVEGYPTWGPYGASKAALDQWTRVLAAEEPTIAVYAADPGDLRTDMHQAAFPGEDISDRPLPDVAAPGLLRLIYERPPSGRYVVQDLGAQRREVSA
ncbi:MAG: SDR family oxidoreductase [Actinomycetota bacterium]